VSRRTAELLALARAFGLQPVYQDWKGRRRTASAESLLGGLRALGAPLEDVAGAGAALRDWSARAHRPGIEPVHVAWDGELEGLSLRFAPRSRTCRVDLHLENGEHRRLQADMPASTRNGGPPLRLPIDAGPPLPLGYHEIVVEDGAAEYRSRVIAAPRKAAAPASRRAWGAFLPLYAFGDPERGAGTYAELRAAADWIGERGGEFLGTLPLLAAFLDEPFEPSPYAPVSRLFWNDLFIDEAALPVGAPPVRVPHSGDTVDYRAAAQARRASLEQAARSFFDAGGEDEAGFRAFAARHPRLDDYARFRAACDHFRAGWPTWPADARDGRLDACDLDPRAVDYYRFTAWCADTQLGAVGDGDAATLYLDLPLGVHPDGYDVWRERALFARGASAGAPPDALFVRGQDWGFPPLDPRALRASGYAYLIECLRHHLQRARMLRLDHVMSLERLYWIPRGLNATEGVYVRYPREELLAVITLESVRHGATIVGEDLGTVSRAIRTALARHGLHRMFVVQYEAAPDRDPPVPSVPKNVVASLNTHDMPPFAAFWHGLDLEDQRALDLLDDQQLAEARVHRARLRSSIAEFFDLPAVDDAAAALHALLGHLAGSAARFVLVNLEDLWLETRPQNVPGTSTERPNWRRRARYTIEQLMREPELAAPLTAVDRERRAAAPSSRRHHESHA
jgi:4-alpha-glucanotransferase